MNDVPFDVFEEDPDSGRDLWESLYKEGSSGPGVPDAASANYYLGRIKQNRKKLESYEEQAKQMKADFNARIETWLKARTSSLDYDTQHCMDMLEMYYEHNKPANGKSISLPEGSIGNYTVQAKYDFDSCKQDVLDILQQNEALHKYIRVKSEIDRTKIKKALTEKDGKLFVDGVELPMVPFTSKTTAFGIR